MKNLEHPTNTQSPSTFDPEDVPTSDEECDPYTEELFIFQRLLHTQPLELTSSQRKNLLNTRCQILGHSCSLIVDSDSCCNCCSTQLVNKISLPTQPHPSPYFLDW